VLIDPQFAPRVIEKPDAAHMVALIASAAKHYDINRFPRFDLMKRWHDIDHLDFETFLSPDGLHMNDWSYSCFAKALSVAISEAAQRPMLSAIATPHVVR
jgi:acyl-CoA thioesterase I